MKKNAAKRRKKKITTGIVATLTVLLVLGLAGTILYTQFFKKEVDRFFEKKYTVTDFNGIQVEYTADELAAEVNYDKFYQGIKVDGVDVSNKTLDEAKAMFKETREKKIDDMVDVQFQVGNDLVKMKTEGMTLSSNIDDVLTEAFGYAKTSTLEGVEGLKDRYDLITALKKTPKEYTSAFTIGYDNVSTLTHEALDSFNQDPVEAHATGFDLNTLSFIIDESSNGQSVNVDKAIEDVNAAFAKEEYKAVIPVDVTVVEPKTSADYLRANLGKISSNGSKTKDNPDRNTNIRLVCEKIDGLVLQPGESFDFNAYVGERTPDKGYKEAPGIYDGKSRPEYGGGICQANTMIYQSVVEADLQVDERNPHTYPSDYVDAGTDATVTWGGKNFRFTNNTEFPVAIHAYYADRWVTVELYGRLLPDGQKISFFGGGLLVNEAPSHTEYIADSSQPVGYKASDRGAHNHKIALAYIVTYDKDGNEISRKELKTEYPFVYPRVIVGTRGPDGTIFKMDPKTGAVTPPDGYVAPTPTPDPGVTPPPETTPGPSDPSDPTNPTPTPEPKPTEPAEPTPKPTEPSDPEPTPKPTEPSDPDPTPTPKPSEPDPTPTPKPTEPSDPEPTPKPEPTPTPEEGGGEGGGEETPAE